MSKIPLAIKYRPKSLQDVIGQEVPVQTLINSFKDNSWHHAYLLAGHLGTGKTTVARIMAAMENDSQGPTLTPNTDDPICKAIFDGKSYDVVELDAASNRTIDDIRDLKNKAQMSPVEGRVKYFIVDESHSLTGHAAEAMLKFIEEPPPRVRIILCTTNPEMLKDTIHSRCIFLNFNKVNWREISKHLQNICQKENINYDENAINFIAKNAKGSVRNSLQCLQNVLSFVGDNNKITLELSQKSLGAIDESVYFELIQNISNIKVAETIILINSMLNKFGNAEYILKGFETYLRNLLLSRTCGERIAELGFNEDEVKRLMSQSKTLPPVLIIKMLDKLVDVQKAINYNGDLQNYLEKMLIESIVELVKLQGEAKK